MFFIIALQALYGFSIPLSKHLLNYAAPFFASSLRMLLAGIGLLGVNLFRKKMNTQALCNAQLHIYACTLYAKYMMRAWYIKELSCARMAFLFNLGPFIAALLSYIVLAQKLSKRQILGMSIGCAASMWPLYAHSQDMQGLSVSAADGVLILAMVLNFYGLITKKKLLAQPTMSIGTVNGVAALTGGSLGLATSWYIEGLFPVNDVASFAGWFTVLLILSNIVCRNLYAFLLKKYSVTFLAFADFLMNICTAACGYVLFGETLTLTYALSSAAVCAGLYIFYQDELRA